MLKKLNKKILVICDKHDMHCMQSSARAIFESLCLSIFDNKSPKGLSTKNREYVQNLMFVTSLSAIKKKGGLNWSDWSAVIGFGKDVSEHFNFGQHTRLLHRRNIKSVTDHKDETVSIK